MSAPEVRGQVVASQAIFCTHDIRESLAYYQEVLGFEGGWDWGDPPTFGGVRWKNISLFFTCIDTLEGKVTGHQHWFAVHDVAALYEQHQETGAEIITPLGDMPWGFTEYVVQDLNGYHLRFAEPTASGAARDKQKPLPEGFRIERRDVTPAEHAAIFASVKWTQHFNMNAAPQAIGGSLCCFVAMNDDQAVGMVRVCGDNAFAYYLQDVAVLAEHQRKGIGTALVQAAMNWLEANAPEKAFVGLFTGRNLAAFYEQFGFQGPDNAFYGMAFRR